MALVTLDITFVSGGADDAAALCWCSDEGGEQQYCEVARGGRITQETFAGHTWVLRGKTSREALLRITAQEDPPVQQFRVDANGEEEEFLRPGRSRGDRPGGPARAAAAPARTGHDEGEQQDPPLNNGDAPPHGPSDDPARPGEDGDAGGCGLWVGENNACRFERVPSQDTGGPAFWREQDLDGQVVGTLAQVDCRVETRWLWWASAAYRRAAGLSHEKEYLAMCLLSIAGAWNLDFRLPAWLGQLAGGHLGPNPLMLVAVVVTLAGAAIAAAVPLTDATLILHNRQTQTEVRLTRGKGYSREVGHDPARPPRPWVAVCAGDFVTVPAELAAQEKQRAHHAAVVAVVVAVGARRLATG